MGLLRAVLPWEMVLGCRAVPCCSLGEGRQVNRVLFQTPMLRESPVELDTCSPLSWQPMVVFSPICTSPHVRPISCSAQCYCNANPSAVTALFNTNAEII